MLRWCETILRGSHGPRDGWLKSFAVVIPRWAKAGPGPAIVACRESQARKAKQAEIGSAKASKTAFGLTADLTAHFTAHFTAHRPPTTFQKNFFSSLANNLRQNLL